MCFKNFTAKSSLVRHFLTTHSDVKFSCAFCPKSYNRKDNLDTHVRSKHQNVCEELNQQSEESDVSEDELCLNINESGNTIFTF